MIRIENLGKTFGSRAAPVVALAGVSLHVTPGVWAVVGPNGAGKTTLLGLTLGFLQPSSGTITIDELEPRRWVRRHGAAYLPERFRLPPEWPVRSAIRALARLDRGGRGPDVDRAADRALGRLGLDAFADRPIGTLSRGLNQRLGLAQALLARGRLVVLDEPTEGLDPLWRVRLREIVEELRRDGRTVLLASHELAEVDRIADHAILLESGRVAEVLEIGAPPDAGPRRYRIVFDGPPEALAAAFPGSERDPDAGQVIVRVADAAELSNRLAAFLDAGGILHELHPVDHDLEARIRSRLRDHGGPE